MDKADVQAIFKAVVENRQRLAACSGHTFVRKESTKPYDLDAYVCTTCGGTARMIEVEWYWDGVDHGLRGVAGAQRPASIEKAVLAPPPLPTERNA